MFLLRHVELTKYFCWTVYKQQRDFDQKPILLQNKGSDVNYTKYWQNINDKASE